ARGDGGHRRFRRSTTYSRVTVSDYYKSQDIAYWFLRLNGFFTIANFVIHPRLRHGSAQTDGDLLAVRFPDRAELRDFGQALVDDPLFATPDGRIDFVIARSQAGNVRTQSLVARSRAWSHRLRPQRRRSSAADRGPHCCRGALFKGCLRRWRPSTST